MAMKCGSVLLLVIVLGKFALCNLLGFGKNLIVNFLGGETIEDINAAQQVKVFGKICDGVRVDLQSLIPCLQNGIQESSNDDGTVGGVTFQNM